MKSFATALLAATVSANYCYTTGNCSGKSRECYPLPRSVLGIEPCYPNQTAELNEYGPYMGSFLKQTSNLDLWEGQLLGDYNNLCAAAYQARGCKPIKSASARKYCEKNAADERKECEKAQWTSLGRKEDEKAAAMKRKEYEKATAMERQESEKAAAMERQESEKAAAMERKEDEQAEQTSELLRMGAETCYRYGGVWHAGMCFTATAEVTLTSVLRNQCAVAYRNRNCRPIKSKDARKNCEKDASDERKECEKNRWTSNLAMKGTSSATWSPTDSLAPITSALCSVGKQCNKYFQQTGRWAPGCCKNSRFEASITATEPVTSALRWTNKNCRDFCLATGDYPNLSPCQRQMGEETCASITAQYASLTASLKKDDSWNGNKFTGVNVQTGGNTNCGKNCSTEINFNVNQGL